MTHSFPTRRSSDLIVPVMLYEVTSRYLFGAPTVWGMELATMLFGPYFLLGGPYLLHLRGHVNLDLVRRRLAPHRSEEHTSELQSLMRISYAVFCLKKKNQPQKSKKHNKIT